MLYDALLHIDPRCPKIFLYNISHCSTSSYNVLGPETIPVGYTPTCLADGTTFFQQTITDVNSVNGYIHHLHTIHVTMFLV